MQKFTDGSAVRSPEILPLRQPTNFVLCYYLCTLRWLCVDNCRFNISFGNRSETFSIAVVVLRHHFNFIPTPPPSHANRTHRTLQLKVIIWFLFIFIALWGQL